MIEPDDPRYIDPELFGVTQDDLLADAKSFDEVIERATSLLYALEEYRGDPAVAVHVERDSEGRVRIESVTWE